MRHLATNLNVSPRRNDQQGMTTLGLIILVIFIGLFVYATVRLVPAYLEDMKVAGTLESIQSEFAGQSPSARDIRNSIEKRFDIESVNIISYRDIKVRKTGTGYAVSAVYENKIPFVANISFTVDFNHSVDIVR